MTFLRTFITLSILTIGILACAGDGTVDASPGGDPDTHPLPVCQEDDFQALPFAGPGVDPQTGALLGEPQASYLASSSIIVINPEKQARFQELAGAVIAGLNEQPGLVGFALGLSQQCGTARTLTVWQSEQAMFDFVTSDVHLAAMAEARVVGINGAVTHWTVARDHVPPSWDEAIAEVAKATPLY